jgi:hypothetical protein
MRTFTSLPPHLFHSLFSTLSNTTITFRVRGKKRGARIFFCVLLGVKTSNILYIGARNTVLSPTFYTNTKYYGIIYSFFFFLLSYAAAAV